MDLPAPDERGNYWMCKDHKLGPAIFPFTPLDECGGSKMRSGTFTVWLGPEVGFLCLLSGIRIYYDSAAKALKALEEHCKDKKKLKAKG